MRKIAIFIAALMIFTFSAVGAMAGEKKEQMSPEEKEYLTRVIAASYPKISYGGRVAIAAVVLNRMETAGYPDFVGGAVMSLAAEGELAGVGKVAGKIDEEVLRLSWDAVEAALRGADPTGGALFFESVEDRVPRDLRFDDSAEDMSHREMQNYFLNKYGEAATIIDKIGFWGRK